MPPIDRIERAWNHLRPPSISFRGGDRGSDELTALAASWRDQLNDDDAPLVAAVMANYLQAVAALFAASSESRPVIVLTRAPAAWRTDPPIPSGTRLILSLAVAELAPEGEALGPHVTVLAEPRALPPSGPAG